MRPCGPGLGRGGLRESLPAQGGLHVARAPLLRVWRPEGSRAVSVGAACAEVSAPVEGPREAGGGAGPTSPNRGGPRADHLAAERPGLSLLSPRLSFNSEARTPGPAVENNFLKLTRLPPYSGRRPLVWPLDFDQEKTFSPRAVAGF